MADPEEERWPMKAYYVVVCELRDLGVGRKLVAALTAQAETRAELVDTVQFKTREIEFCRRHTFFVFIGRNRVSEPYIRPMEVHDLHTGVKWGIDPSHAAAIWLDRQHPPSVPRLRRQLRQEAIDPVLPDTPADVFKHRALVGWTGCGVAAILAILSAAVRRQVEYNIGVLEFLKHGLALRHA